MFFAYFAIFGNAFKATFAGAQLNKKRPPVGWPFRLLVEAAGVELIP